MSWESWNIRDHILEYEDESHTYICDGLVVPSVTTVLGEMFNQKYANIPTKVLNEAARKGTLLHKAIENAEKAGSFGFAEDYILSPAEQEIAEEFRSYIFLKRSYGFTCEGSEMPLLLKFEDKIVAAGRMDMLVMDRDGRLGIADIKRTAQMDKNWLSYQLTLYSYGLAYSYNINAEFLRCIWLREDKRKYAEIPFCDDLAQEVLEGLYYGS